MIGLVLDGAEAWFHGLARTPNAHMISNSSLDSIAHYVANKLKSSRLVNLTTYGDRSGTSRNRLREPKNKRDFWGEGSTVQNAVLQTSIVSSFIVLPFGNALTVAMKVPS